MREENPRSFLPERLNGFTQTKMPKLVLSRSIDDQLTALTAPERLAFETLREYWDSKPDKLVEYDDYMILLLLRTSPGDFKFNVKTATKVAERYAHYALQYNIPALRLDDVREIMEKKIFVLHPTGNLRNKNGDVIIYFRAHNLFPAKTSVDALLQFMAYQLACVTSEEDAAVNGVCVLANTQSLAMANFSLQMYNALITFMLGRAPLRVRRVAIVSFVVVVIVAGLTCM